MMNYAGRIPKSPVSPNKKAGALPVMPSRPSQTSPVLQRTPLNRAEDIHVLQAMVGNQAVGQLLAGNRDQDQRPEQGPSSLPGSLRSGIEQMSGMDMSDVRVHANSDKPAHVGALAFTSGNDIYLQPGQERHLPHEAWHAVQQKTGRVQPTTQLAGVAINDDASLEKEADVMGARALQAKAPSSETAIQRSEADEEEEIVQPKTAGLRPVVQRNIWDAISGSIRDSLDNPLGPVLDPIETIFDQVVATNRAMASSIGIPATWTQAVMQYAALNPVDGAILIAAMARMPTYFRGGWIMDLQPRASAMTLDHSIFVPTGRTLSLATYVHELVHVFQNGLVGVTAFLVSYFGMSAATIAYRWLRNMPTNPMQSSPHETQAYDLEARFVSWYTAQHGQDPHNVSV